MCARAKYFVDSIDQCNRRYVPINNYTNALFLFAMISTDIDSDNKSDIIVIDLLLKRVVFLFNDGNGQFTIHIIVFPPNYSPYSISTADLNNDQQIDIIILDELQKKNHCFS